MPRTLPWLIGASKTKRESNSPATQIKRTSNPRVKDETPTKKGALTSGRDLLKSSPSPPSSPIHRCPSEEFLHEGLHKDDMFMMVEDEFYAVAQTFTQHLHYAEFIRRKKEAKLQNAATIADIARPTDGVTPMSDELKKKYVADELSARQRNGLDKVVGKQARDEDAGDDIEENSWAGTHLQDLMLSPRRVRSLVGLQGIRSTTRAAAGFSQSSGSDLRGSDVRDNEGCVEEGQEKPALPGDTTTDDEDLDAGVGQSTPTIARGSHDPSGLGSLRDSSYGMRLSNSMRRTCEKGSTIKVHQSTPSITTRNHVSSSSGSLHQSSFTTGSSEKRSSEDVKDEIGATDSKNIFMNTTQAKKRLKFDDFDELPEPHKPGIQVERQRPQFTNSKQKKLNGNDTRLKKSRLNEVPTFLI
ncbi:hypothetical protein BDW62DRAFT_41130 [Aspergillus aurantiobrunneus]